MKTRAGFFEKVSKTDKPLDRFTKKKRDKDLNKQNKK